MSGAGSDDLFTTLVAGLEHDERTRTMELIRRRIIEDRAAAVDGRQERHVDTGTRTRSSRSRSSAHS
jgi:hypothetical protein